MVIIRNRAYLPRYRKTNFSETITSGRTIRPDVTKWMVAITFKNVGGANATVNGLKCNVGDSPLIFDGDINSIDETTYDLRFLGTVNPAVEVTKTFVIDFSIISKEIPMTL